MYGYVHFVHNVQCCPMCVSVCVQPVFLVSTQAVEFIVAMLQRACVCLEQGGEGPVEAQTLRMGMGLVAALMSGDTKVHTCT